MSEPRPVNGGSAGGSQPPAHVAAAMEAMQLRGAIGELMLIRDSINERIAALEKMHDDRTAVVEAAKNPTGIIIPKPFNQ